MRCSKGRHGRLTGGFWDLSLEIRKREALEAHPKKASWKRGTGSSLEKEGRPPESQCLPASGGTIRPLLGCDPWRRPEDLRPCSFSLVLRRS